MKILVSITLLLLSTFVSAQINRSLHFDGNNDYVSFTSGPNLAGQSFTIEFWAKKDVSSDGYALTLGDDAAENVYLHLGFNTNTSFRAGFYGDDITYTGFANDGIWHHWAVTYEAGISGIDRRLYLDGVEVASDNAAGNFEGTAVLELGRAELINRYFKGHLDEVRIWSTVRSVQEIADNMSCQVDATEIGLLARYGYNHGVGGSNNSGSTTLTDHSANANHGTLENFTLFGATSNWSYDTGFENYTITTHPQNQTVLAGEDLNLSVTLDDAFCPGITYQWLKDLSPIVGETQQTLTISEVDTSDAGNYLLQILYTGTTISTQVAEVDVLPPPEISATNDSSDYYIDVAWSLPPLPCLFDSNDEPYTEVTTRLLKDGQEIQTITYDENDLAAFYGPVQPSIDFVAFDENDVFVYDFSDDPIMQGVNNYTIEMWIKTVSDDENLRLFGNIGNSFEHIQISQNDKIQMWTNGIYKNSASLNLSEYTWNHIALVVDAASSNTSIYINGEPNGSIDHFFPLADYSEIGPSDGTVFLLGEMRIWDEKRTAFEIAQNYGFDDPTTFNNLIVQLKSENINNTFSDHATAYDGTAQNFVISAPTSEFIPTTDYLPILGNYRDLVGAEMTHNYEMQVFGGPFGGIDIECFGLTDIGATLPVQAPDLMSATTDNLDRINLTWRNNSDLATSFVVYRNDELIGTVTENIAKGNIITYEDIFEFENENSISSGIQYDYDIKMISTLTGQNWTYNLGMGNTLDINFTASDPPTFTNKVFATWDNTAQPLIDNYKIYRGSTLRGVYLSSITEYDDFMPHFGDSINYQLRLIEDDTIRAVFNDHGSVAGNGSISGRVVTENGLYPLNNVTVNILRKSNQEVLSTTTNVAGEFSFVGLSYGLIDSFSFEAILSGSTFSYPQNPIGLSANSPTVNNKLILSDIEFSVDNNDQFVDHFNAIGDDAKDMVALDWGLTTNSSNIFIDIVRNGQLIYNSNLLVDLNGVTTDLTGVPGEETNYQIRIYDIDGLDVSEANYDTTLIFPLVSKIPEGNFLVTEEMAAGNGTGNIHLSWTHTSSNVDAYRIYRNDDLIAELEQGNISYVDDSAPFNQDLFYEISAIRSVNGITHETIVPTASTPSIINLNDYPAPQNVVAVAVANTPRIEITWSDPMGVNSNYNYSGYYIYRNDNYIGRVYKGSPLIFYDLEGFGQNDIVYKVSTFREIPNGIIESSLSLAAAVSFPDYASVPSLVAQSNHVDGTIDLTWDADSYNNTTTNYDGYIIKFEGDIIAKLPSFIQSYSHFGIEEEINNFDLHVYKNVGELEYISEIKSSASSFLESSSGVVYPPQNVLASRDLPNHVKVCWEYLDFIKSRFIIYKDDEVLDTLSVGARSYYDYAAAPANHAVEYKVKAINEGQSSRYSGAVGDMINPIMIYGRLQDLNNMIGISDAEVKIEVQGIKTTIAKTDSSGYYSIMMPNEIVDQMVTVYASPYNDEDAVSSNILIGEDERYQVNLAYDFLGDTFLDDVAEVSYFDIDINPYDLHGTIHWQTENDNYTGIEIKRGIEEVAILEKGEGNIYIDESAIPGITYTYFVRSYLDDDNGREYFDYNIQEISYSKLESVINLTATPNLYYNQVTIQWSHLYDHADGYLISRNNQLVADLNDEDPFIYIDNTGTAGDQYEYQVVAYKVINNEIIFSEEKSVIITYPAPSPIVDLTLSTPFEANVDVKNTLTVPEYYLNHVLLEWDYLGGNVAGYKVYRNDELLKVLTSDSTSFEDYTGHPNQQYEYAVSAIVNQNGTINESIKLKQNFTFPVIERPFEFEAIARNNIGDVKVQWKYKSPTVDKFKILRKYSDQSFFTLIATIDQDLVLDGEGLNIYYDKESKPDIGIKYRIKAFSTREGIEYQSGNIEHQVNQGNYPCPPTPTNFSGTMGTYEQAVQLTWNYNSNANIDSFHISTLTDGVFSSVATVGKRDRSYLEDFSDREDLVEYTYFLTPGRFIDGSMSYCTAESSVATLGYPGAINTIDTTEYTFGTSDQQLGQSIAIEGDYMVVGAPEERSAISYKMIDGKWNAIQVLIGPQFSRFGISVDISGDLLVIGAPLADDEDGQVYLYKLLGDQWFEEKIMYGPNGEESRMGWSVAIDGNKVVAGQPFANFTNDFTGANFPKALSVFERNSGCALNNDCWSTLTNLNDNPNPNSFLNHSGNTSSFRPKQLGWSVDIEGDRIVLGDRAADIYELFPEPNSIGNEEGYVVEYEIDGNDVRAKKIIFNENNVTSSDPSWEQFGWDVSLDGDRLAIGARRGLNGEITAGRVYIHEADSSGDWVETQLLLSDSPGSFQKFGYAVELKDDLLAISEPFITNSTRLQSKVNLYQYNNVSNEFEIKQSSNIDNPNYREEFYDDANPDKYPYAFGSDIAISDFHIAVGAPDTYYDLQESGTNVGQGAFYLFDLFPVNVTNVEATDGNLDNTRISWEVECYDCPSDYIDSIRVYRDAELIGLLEGSSTQFFDEAVNLLAGVDEAVVGVEYLYEVQAVIDPLYKIYSDKVYDLGYSKRIGKLSGDVYVAGTQNGVPNVDILIQGEDNITGQLYEYTTTTQSDGSFNISGLYVAEEGIVYQIIPSFENHTFYSPISDSFLLTIEDAEESNTIFYDETAYLVNGEVQQNGGLCSVDNIKVYYYETISGIESLVDSVLTEDGAYSIVVDPTTTDLQSIRIEVPNIQYVESNSTTQAVLYSFESVGSNIYNNFSNFPLINSLDFIESYSYPVDIYIKNSCENPIADQPIEIRVSSLDGCYEEILITDNQGYAQVNLPPKNYTIAVNDIVGSGVDNYENSAIDYLKLRQATLNLKQIHEDAGLNPPLTVDSVVFVYHTGVQFGVASSFERFQCDDSGNPAIITQGQNHSLSYTILENHRPGETCEVNDGYLEVRNSGATNNQVQTLQISNGNIPTYAFRAGLPNLVPPHTHAISTQYYSNQGNLLGGIIMPIIVEGQRQLPGTGIITDAANDEAGELKLPLMVLRDPPGDGSFSAIESGTTIEKTLSLADEDNNSSGFVGETGLSFGAGGFFIDANVGGGSNNSSGASYDFSLTTTQTYATSDDEGAIGRPANVIVGTGLSTQYGLTQNLNFPDNCIPVSSTNLSFGIGGFNSTFAYTVEFMENLVDGYRQDSIEIENDLLVYISPDGTPYEKAIAIQRVSALISSWEQMLHYHDVETVPHYVLCNDFSYRDSLSLEAIEAYEDWRDGFCTQIGSYEDDIFTMDDEITWTPDLIASYNNVVAFADTLKGLQLDAEIGDNLYLSNNEITSNALSVTNQFHNTLGNSVKSAEVFDLSGNVGFERTVTTQQSSSTEISSTRFFYLDVSAGYFLSQENNAGIGLTTKLTELEIKLGGNVTNESNVSISKSQAEANESTIYYNIFDDDAEDQITVLALQAPLQDQTPYFIRLGGLSSCPPEEALTLNQDNDPILIDDPTITVVIDPISGATTPNPPPVHNVADGSSAIFQIQMGNLGPTGQSRDAEIFLDLESNPFGAIVKLGGSDLNIVSPEFSIPAGGSITQFLTIERPSSTPFYDFEGLRIGIQPACGGEAKFIELDVYFETPCSPVSLSKPIDGHIVNRINPNIANDREVIPFELRDYQSSNLNLQHIQLQYRRLGTGENWKNVPGGLIHRSTLAASDANLAFGQDPLYFFEWDITGFYNLYPDGEYLTRALAFCGTSGIQYSNHVQVNLNRSALLLNGYPEPADRVWTMGDEISSTYNLDIDCGVISVTDSIQNYLTLIDLTTMMSVPFTHICQNNKLMIMPTDPMSNYDGHTLRATYHNITNLAGTNAPDVIWDFEVVTQEVDWDDQLVEVTLYEYEIKTHATSLFNTTGGGVNGLQMTGGTSWLSFAPSDIFSVPADGLLVDLTFDGSIGVGNYQTTLQVQNLTGRIPEITVILNVIEEPPLPEVDPDYTDSMQLVVNWSFLSPYEPSNDVLDQIQVYKDGQFRGASYIEEQGNFFFSKITVYGNEEDEDGLLDFVIWNADEPQAYTPISSTVIPFIANSTRGVITNPEILLVEDDLFSFRKRIYVDSTNVSGLQDGLTWATAFSDLQDALDIVIQEDTIWMAQGTYYPTETADRSISFVLDESVAIHGGFVSGMSSLHDRTGTDETILSGNIGVKTTDIDNSYHVVQSNDEDILLDQLTIVGGNASEEGDDGKGACLYNTATITLKDCRMSNGNSLLGGSLIYNSGIMTLDKGVFTIDPLSNISSLLNDSGAIINISRYVEFKQ